MNLFLSHHKEAKKHESLPFSSEESRGLVQIVGMRYFRLAYRDNSFI